jgi:hypothetical protein
MVLRKTLLRPSSGWNKQRFSPNILQPATEIRGVTYQNLHKSALEKSDLAGYEAFSGQTHSWTAFT